MPARCRRSSAQPPEGAHSEGEGYGGDERGHMTASMTACSDSGPLVGTPGLPKASRTAVVVHESGFHMAMAPSQAGMSSGEAKALEIIVTG